MYYTIIRSKRKTSSILLKDGAIVVKVPIQAKDDAIDAFVQSKKEWIQKNLPLTTNTFLDDKVTNYNAVMLSGHIVPICFLPKKNTTLQDGVLYINDKYKNNAKQQIVKFLTTTARQSLGAELDRVAKVLSIEYSKFDISHARTKWGSCDNKNGILLNFRLVCLPRKLMLYVIVHELCHIIHHNHSSDFWKLVAQICKDFKSYKTELKKWSTLNKVY